MHYHKHIYNNISIFGIVRFLTSLSIFMPIITLYFQDNNISLSQIFLLQSIYSFAVFIFEVPTGYFGDKIARKTSMAIGLSLFAVWLCVYGVGSSFWAFALSEIILALGSSFISWSDSALLYDGLKLIWKTDRYKHIEWRLTFIGEWAWAIGGIIGWILAQFYSLRVVLWISWLLVACSVPFVLYLYEEKTIHQSNDKNLWKDMRSIIRLSLHENAHLKRIIIYTGLLSSSTLAMVWATQPYLKELGLQIIRFGFVRAGLRAMVSLSGLIAGRWDSFWWWRNSLLSLLCLSVLWFLISWISGTLIFWLFWLSLFQIQRWLQKSIANHAIHELITSEMRATVLSVNSMIGRLMYAILGPVIGYMWDLYGLQMMFFLCAILFGILGWYAFLKIRK